MPDPLILPDPKLSPASVHLKIRGFHACIQPQFTRSQAFADSIICKLTPDWSILPDRSILISYRTGVLVNFHIKSLSISQYIRIVKYSNFNDPYPLNSVAARIVKFSHFNISKLAKYQRIGCSKSEPGLHFEATSRIVGSATRITIVYRIASSYRIAYRIATSYRITPSYRIASKSATRGLPPINGSRPLRKLADCTW